MMISVILRSPYSVMISLYIFVNIVHCDEREHSRKDERGFCVVHAFNITSSNDS